MMHRVAIGLLGLSVAQALPAQQQPQPSIRIDLNQDRAFEIGDRAKVQVTTRDDAYLLVLHVTPDGRFRVLFPLDPEDDNFVRGQRLYQLTGRGGRNSFDIDSKVGRGTVFAAITRSPVNFADFSLNGHWDYRKFAPDQSLSGDMETALVDLANSMLRARYDYDLAQYNVYDRTDQRDWYPTYSSTDPGYVGVPVPVGVGGGWCDPYYYGTTVCGAGYGGGWYGAGYGPYGYGGWGHGYGVGVVVRDGGWGYGGRWGYGGGNPNWQLPAWRDVIPSGPSNGQILAGTRRWNNVARDPSAPAPGNQATSVYAPVPTPRGPTPVVGTPVFTTPVTSVPVQPQPVTGAPQGQAGGTYAGPGAGRTWGGRNRDAVPVPGGDGVIARTKPWNEPSTPVAVPADRAIPNSATPEGYGARAQGGGRRGGRYADDEGGAPRGWAQNGNVAVPAPSASPERSFVPPQVSVPRETMRSSGSNPHDVPAAHSAPPPPAPAAAPAPPPQVPGGGSRAAKREE